MAKRNVPDNYQPSSIRTSRYGWDNNPTEVVGPLTREEAVVQNAIEFLLISDGSPVLRYTTNGKGEVSSHLPEDYQPSSFGTYGRR